MIDLRERLLEAFAGERAEHVAAIRAGLAEQAAGRAVDIADLFRRMHSLKGAARAVELPAVEAVAHEMEALLAAVERGDLPFDHATAARLHRALDAIEDGRGLADPVAPAPAADMPVPAVAEAPAADPAPAQRIAGAYLDALGRSLADLGGRLQAGAAAEHLPGIAAALAALRGRADVQLGAEAAAELARIERRLADARRRIVEEDAGIAQGLAAVERAAERLMLVPADEVFGGLARMVREIAEAAGKQAELSVEGGAVEADRRVLEALRDPVRHLLRNAIGHGIEAPDRRRAAGKPAAGRVRLGLRIAGHNLVVEVADDGAGPDFASIARRRAAAGVHDEDRDALLAHLFDQGFSTAATVDRISGRGVGLAAVADTVHRLQGSVAMEAPAAGGTLVRITVALGLARQAVVLVEAGDERIAIPARAVSRALHLRRDAIERVAGRDLVPVEADAPPVPVVALSRVLGFAEGTPAGGAVPALLIGSGRRRLAVTVDRLDRARSLVVGAASAIGVAAPLVAGTALVDGERAVLVLSGEALLAAAWRASRSGGGSAIGGTAAEESSRRRTILVVDDSITTRTLEKGILAANGYRVMIAVDGLAGLEALRAAPGAVDLVVADVEMPRMDGFGLLTSIRNDPALANIPVIMMTSRNSPDDIRRGLDLGASAYVTKQEFDQGRLIETVARLI